MYGLRVARVHRGVCVRGIVIIGGDGRGSKLSQRECALTLGAHLTLLVSHCLELLLSKLGLLHAAIARV